MDHREGRILAESVVGFGQVAPIEDAAGGGGDGGGMAAGVAKADRVHRGSHLFRQICVGDETVSGIWKKGA